MWLLATATAAAGTTTLPSTWASARPGAGPTHVNDLIVAICATALAVALGWLWVVTTTTVVGLVTGRARPAGATRRLVLLACGVAVVAGTSVPAFAAGGDGRELLAGLSLPDRAVAPVRHHHAARPLPEAEPPAEAGTGTGGTYVVRPGDSLSSIALAHLGTESLDDRWRAIWRANRDVVGDDPDLIFPGQALRLPEQTHPTHEDGDRR